MFTLPWSWDVIFMFNNDASWLTVFLLEHDLYQGTFDMRLLKYNILDPVDQSHDS